MLPKFLESSYKRYKADTETFTTWIATVGEKCYADETGSTSSKASSKSKYKVQLQQLKIWAKAIKASRTKVPQSVLAAGRRAVTLRTRCANWFKQKLGGGEKQNDSHAHFIQVLEQVLETLEWDTVGSKTPAQSENPGPAGPYANKDAKGLGNRFAALEVEDYGSDDGNTEPTPAPVTSSREKEKKPPSQTYNFDDEVDEAEEKLFHIFCLFEDLERIRNFLQQTWKDYGTKTIDLMTASLTTNTALDLVREQCDEFVKLYPDMDGLGGATQMVWIMHCLASGRGPYYKESPSDAFDYGLMDTATWCLLPTYQLLDAFTRVLGPKFVPVYNGQYGWYDAKADRTSMNVREKYNDDSAFLMQHLSEFAFLANFKLPLPIKDELTRGLGEMCKTKKVPIWLAFAAQVYLDIKNLLRAQPNQGFNDLRLAGLRAKQMIKDHFKFHEAWPDAAEANWAKQNDQIMHDVTQFVEVFVENDWFFKCLQSTIERAGTPKEDFALFKSHPLLCGVLIFHFNLRMQELGLILMNAWGTGIYAAYMYNAIQQDQSDMGVQWPDMDKLIELHTEEHLFLGPRPTNHEDSFKKICLATGMDNAAFSGGRKFPKSAKQVREARGLEEPSVISKVYRNRYCYGGVDALDLSTKNVEAVLNDLANKKLATEAGSKRMRKKFRKQQKLTTLQLLTALQERLIDEEQSLKFNYLGMNTRVLQLFKCVKVAVDPQIASKFGPNYLDDDTQICAVVHFMLTYASLAIQGSRALGLKEIKGMKFSSKCIVAAGGVLKEFVKTKGDVALKELNTFCANKPKLDTVARAEEREKQAMTYFSVDELIRSAVTGGPGAAAETVERIMAREMSGTPGWTPGWNGI